MGQSGSKTENSAKPEFPNTRIPNAAAFLAFSSGMIGDNGPGDDFVGKFPREWDDVKAIAKKPLSEAQKQQILNGWRFHHCKNRGKKKLVAVLTVQSSQSSQSQSSKSSQAKLYVIHTIGEVATCYTLNVTGKVAGALQAKWKAEHMKKTCAVGFRPHTAAL